MPMSVLCANSLTAERTFGVAFVQEKVAALVLARAKSESPNEE